MRSKTSIIKLFCVLISVACLSIFVLPKIYYAIIDSNKNHYQLSAPRLDVKKLNKTGVMLTVTVSQPQKETITITSDNRDERNWLGGDNIEQFFSSEHPELASDIELLDNGIKLRLKASDKKVNLKIPVEMSETATTTFNIRRGKRAITKEKVVFKRPDEKQTKTPKPLAKETATTDKSTPNLLTKQSMTTNGKPSSLIMNSQLYKSSGSSMMKSMAYPSGSGSFTTTAEVSTYSELLAAVANKDISRIEFKNDITADSRQPSTVTRDLVIDGKGFLFNAIAHRNQDVFQLGDISSANSWFILGNMRVDYSGASSGKAFVSVPKSGVLGWEIILEDIESEGAATNHGRLVFNHSGTTRLTGKISWQSRTSSETSNSDKYGGVINSANIKIMKNDEGKEPVINISAKQTLLRAYKSSSNAITRVIVEAGEVNLYSVYAQAIHMNDEVSNAAVVFHVKGKNTRLNVTASGGNKNALGGAISIIGNNWTGDAKGKSYTRIEDGAQVRTYSMDSPRNGRAGAAFVNQVTHGVFYLTGKGTKMTCEADTPAGVIEATFRFRVVGNQTFFMSDEAELRIIRNNGKTAGLRFYGQNNAFYISGGAKVLIDNYGRGDNSPSDGGDDNGRQGIQYPGDGGGTSVFDLKGKGSDVAVNARFGPALEGSAGAFKFFAGEQASISFIGNTRSARSGALMLPINSLDITLNTPYFYEFRNNRFDGGSWLSGGNSRSKLKATNTELEVWKKGRNVNLDGPSSNSWIRMDYELSGMGFTKINSSSNPNFNKSTYGQASDYAKISGGSLEADIESIRQPTNADKRIYGHAVVASTYDAINGQGATRDAYTNEVWVTLKLYRLKFKSGVTEVQRDPVTLKVDFDKTYDIITYEKEVPTIGHKGTTTGTDKDTDGVSQYGEPKTYGIFEWDLTKDERIKEDDYLWAGEYVEVINVRRGDKTPRPGYDIITPKEKYQNKGRYVFNVRPVEVSTDHLTQGHIDPLLDVSTAKTTISDATKSIRFQASAKNMKTHATVVPFDKIGATSQPNYGGITETGQVSFYPMLFFANSNRTTPSAEVIDPTSKQTKNSQLDLYSYLNTEGLSGNNNAELFAFTRADYLLLLKQDLPPTFQKEIVTTTDDSYPVDGGNNTGWNGLRMPSQERKYHDETFKPSVSLVVKNFSPTSLTSTISKRGGGDMNSVNLTKEQLVTYQVKLSNPNLQLFPDQLLLGYSITVNLTGGGEIFDLYGMSLPSGVTETHTIQSITFTCNSRATLSEGVNIPVAITGDFKLSVRASGRTPQEKTFALPRGSWDEVNESHNFSSDGFTPGLSVPNANLPDYLTYYRFLSAPEQTVSVSTSRIPVANRPQVYLAITDNKLTVYYRQLSANSEVKVRVDGKDLTSFNVTKSDVEQAKPLNLKINGIRNVVKVTYTTADGTTKTVTWKNPKITN